MTLSKTERRVHLQKPALSQPYGLTYHRGVIFWSEFEKGHIMKMDLTSNNISRLLDENPQSFDLKVFDSEKQPQNGHFCGKNGDFCEDLCLVMPNNEHVCHCQDGKKLQKDGKSCEIIPDWVPASYCRNNQFNCLSNNKCIDEQYV